MIAIRRFLIALCALLILCPTAGASKVNTIRVLILTGRFANPPAPDESIHLMDRVSGKFVTGSDEDYLGEFQIWRGTGGLYLINELPLEEYVEGVVRSETGRGWAMEALKAQAVAVRTYVLQRKQVTDTRSYDVTSSVLDQVYGGRNANTAVAQAVKATQGQILTFDGAPIEALYHSTSGKVTELPEEVFGTSHPYLKSVESDCTLSPFCLWTRRIPLGEIERIMGLKHISQINVLERTQTGRAKDVEIISNPKAVVLKATDLRKTLGWRRLPSTDFSVTVKGDKAVFEGQGFGHGVGMSQWSSQEMAIAGQKYGDILAHFYPGAELTNTPE
jgi:stage II sporulation protein D